MPDIYSFYVLATRKATLRHILVNCLFIGALFPGNIQGYIWTHTTWDPMRSGRHECELSEVGTCLGMTSDIARALSNNKHIFYAFEILLQGVNGMCVIVPCLTLLLHSS